MFLSLDGTFWVQLINFAIFFAILNVVFLRPVGEALKRRRAHIDGVRTDFERYDRQLVSLRSDADAKRTAARRAAEERVANARLAAEAEATATIAAATAHAQSIADAARETVARETAVARDREDELSRSLARQLLARAIGSGT